MKKLVEYPHQKEVSQAVNMLIDQVARLADRLDRIEYDKMVEEAELARTCYGLQREK